MLEGAAGPSAKQRRAFQRFLRGLRGEIVGEWRASSTPQVYMCELGQGLISSPNLPVTGQPQISNGLLSFFPLCY